MVDTNIIFLLFKNTGSFKEFIKRNDLELMAPGKIMSELKKYSDRICEISGLNKNEFDSVLEQLPKIISLFNLSKRDIKNLISKTPDPKDTPFLALAVKFNAPLWSEDKQLKKQSLAKVYNFDELKDLV